MLFSLSFILFAACAAQPVKKAPSFVAQPIQGEFVPKVDHLYFILDASSSMDDPYAGHTKFDAAKAIVANFNQTMPDMKVQAALRGIGFSIFVSQKDTRLFYGPGDYTRADLAKGLQVITQPGGFSALGKALTATAADLEESLGNVAVVVVSDGEDMGPAELVATNDLIGKLADRLCLYVVFVGDDPAGRSLLEKIAATAACGKFTSADSLASGSGMAAFVRDVLLTEKAAAVVEQADTDGDGVPDDRDRCPNTPQGVTVDASGCPTDYDGDGVYDYLDKCPGTPRGTRVDASGCPVPVATGSAEVTAAGTWIYRDIRFETNKAVLESSSYPVMDEIAENLKAQPSIKVEVQGHTDNVGSAEYNMKLSQARAESVKRYLVDKGVAPERLMVKGYGQTKPIVPNDTPGNRAKNRRVEFAPIQ